MEKTRPTVHESSLTTTRPGLLPWGYLPFLSINAKSINFHVVLIGYGAGGRLGIGGSDSVCQPTLLESIQHICIKTVRSQIGKITPNFVIPT